MNKVYNIQDFTVTPEELSFIIKGEKISIFLKNSGSRLLQKAKEDHLKIFEIDIDGIGVHWPVLDEDLSISGLLRVAGREDLVVSDIPSIYSEDLEAKAS